MNNRLLALTGPVFAVLFAVSAALEGNAPNEKAGGAAVVKFFDDHHDKTLASVFLSPLLVVLALVFFAYLRSLARAGGADATGAGPTVMIAGAAVWTAGALVGSMIDLALVDAADHNKTAAAETLNQLYAADWLPFIAGIAATLIGAGMAFARTGVLPRWLGWVALVVGIVSLAGPGGFLGFFVIPLWMLVAGILLLVRDRGAVAIS